MGRSRKGARWHGNRAAVLRRDEGLCRYCGFPADGVDHVVPYCYSQDASMDNLVAACERCNTLANSFVFASFTEKRDWLLDRRRPEILRAAGYHPTDVDAGA